MLLCAVANDATCRPDNCLTKGSAREAIQNLLSHSKIIGPPALNCLFDIAARQIFAQGSLGELRKHITRNKTLAKQKSAEESIPTRAFTLFRKIACCFFQHAAERLAFGTCTFDQFFFFQCMWRPNHHMYFHTAACCPDDALDDNEVLVSFILNKKRIPKSICNRSPGNR